MAALALIRLYHYTQNQDYISKAEAILSKTATVAAENPFAFGQLLNGVFMYVRKPKEVTLITDEQAIPIEWFSRMFLPEGIIAVTRTNDMTELKKFAFFKGKESIKGKSFTAYVCKDFTCSMPLHSIEDLKINLIS
jgi:hypothetical protein